MVRIKIKLLVTFVSVTDFFFVLITSWIPDIQLVFQDEKSCVRSFFPINFWFVFGLCFAYFLCRTIALVRRNLFTISEMGAHRNWFCRKILGSNRNFRCQSSGKEKKVEWLVAMVVIEEQKGSQSCQSQVDHMHWQSSPAMVVVVEQKAKGQSELSKSGWSHALTESTMVKLEKLSSWVTIGRSELDMIKNCFEFVKRQKLWEQCEKIGDPQKFPMTQFHHPRLEIKLKFSKFQFKWEEMGGRQFQFCCRMKAGQLTPLSLKTKNSNFELTQVERGENAILNLLQEESRLVWTLSLKTEWKWKC